MKIICLFLSLLFLFTACGPSDPLDGISAELGADLTAGTLVYGTDNHSGFHGDGTTILQVVLPDFTPPESPNWHPLPLTENLSRVFFGTSGDAHTQKPLCADEYGNPILPRIENGCYFFLDRHSQSTDPADDTDLFSRYSWNFTAAVYDFDTATLYFFRFDT